MKVAFVVAQHAAPLQLRTHPDPSAQHFGDELCNVFCDGRRCSKAWRTPSQRGESPAAPQDRARSRNPLQQCFLRRWRPRQTMTLGAMTSICRMRNGEHDLTSSSSGLAILGRPALHHVADVNVFALQAHGFDHLRQKFPARPTNGRLGRLHRRRGLPHENQFGFGISVAENNFVARVVEFAARAFARSSRVFSSESPCNFLHGLEERRPRNDRQGCDLRNHGHHDWRGFLWCGLCCGLGQCLFL